MKRVKKLSENSFIQRYIKVHINDRFVKIDFFGAEICLDNKLDPLRNILKVDIL